jgi:trafficking protein particle complex subunit 8
MSILAKQPMTLQITHVSYMFLSLLPARESLSSRGRRLQDTPHQRQNKVYAPDIIVKVEVEDAAQRLSVEFFDDSRLVLYHGECRPMGIWLSNTGTQAIGDIWLVSGEDDEFWINETGDQDPGMSQTTLQSSGEASVLDFETFDSDNSLLPRSPYRVPLTSMENALLAPGASFELPFMLHANKLGEQELCFLLTFREVCKTLWAVTIDNFDALFSRETAMHFIASG